MSRQAAPIERPPRHTRPVALLTFGVALVGLSALFDGLIIHAGSLGSGGGAFLTGLMWSPALAAFVAVARGPDPLRALGLARAGLPAWPVAYLLPVAYAGAAYGLAWALGLGRFPDPAYIAHRRESLGWAGAGDAAVVLGSFALTATTGLAHSLANALGEEIGWRGLLDPVLRGRLGFLPGALLTGVIWSLWHLPILLFADYHSASPLAFALPCFAVLVLSVAVILAWLRERADSVWPCAVLHAAHNLLIQGVFGAATQSVGRGGDFALGEFGWTLAAVVPIAALTLTIIRRRRRLPRAPA